MWLSIGKILTFGEELIKLPFSMGTFRRLLKKMSSKITLKLLRPCWKGLKVYVNSLEKLLEILVGRLYSKNLRKFFTKLVSVFVSLLRASSGKIFLSWYCIHVEVGNNLSPFGSLLRLNCMTLKSKLKAIYTNTCSWKDGIKIKLVKST